MVAVNLSIHEVVACYTQAGFRITASEAQRLNHASTYDRPIRVRFTEEAVGCMGERAFCKWLGCYSTQPINTFHNEADCGKRYEVRTTARPDGCLIFRTNDHADRIYVFATAGEDGVVALRGWIRGEDCMKDEFFRDPGGVRPSWFVPISALNTMETLPR